MKRPRKPVRKCHDCDLNLGDCCAIFDDPRNRWHRKRCSGYKNEELLEEYKEGAKKYPPRTARERRKLEAKLRNTKVHYGGRRCQYKVLH